MPFKKGVLRPIVERFFEMISCRAYIDRKIRERRERELNDGRNSNRKRY